MKISNAFLIAFFISAFAVIASAQPGNTPARKEAARLSTSALALLESAQKNRSSSSATVNEQNFKRAFDEANKAVAADPSFETSYFVRAKIYTDTPDTYPQELKNRDLALQDYDKAISLKPTFAAAYFWRGMTRLKTFESVSTTNAMLEGFMGGLGVKKDVNITDSRGNSKAQIIDLALADLGKAVSLEPSATHYFGRGKAYAVKENYQLAEADLQQALKLDPTFQLAKNALASLPTAADRAAGDWDFTNILGTSPIKFVLRFAARNGVPSGAVIASNGNQTPLQNVVIKPDRTLSFRLVTSNGATLDCTGTFGETYATMAGQSKITFNGQSGAGTFTAKRRP